MAAGLLLAACTSGGGGSESGSGGEPEDSASPASDETLTELWHADIDGGRTSVAQLWAPDEGPVVSITNAGVVGFDPESGEEMWELEPPEAADVPCSASADVNDDGVGAVLYERAGNCRVLVVVDARGGDVLWDEDLSDPLHDGINLPQAPAVTVGENVVTANPSFIGPLYRFAVDGGDPLPPLATPWDVIPACQGSIAWRHSAAYTIAIPECVDGEQLAAFETESGQALWTADLPLDVTPDNVGQVLSGDDLVIEVNDTLLAFDSSGEVRAELPGGVGVVAGSVLVSTDQARAIAGSMTVTGYELDSGEELWSEQMEAGTLTGSDTGTGTGTGTINYADGDPLLFSGVVGDDGLVHHLAWLDPQSGATVQETFVPNYSASGTGAVMSRDGVVYVLAISPQVQVTAYRVPA